MGQKKRNIAVGKVFMGFVINTGETAKDVF